MVPRPFKKLGGDSLLVSTPIKHDSSYYIIAYPYISSSHLNIHLAWHHIIFKAATCIIQSRRKHKKRSKQHVIHLNIKIRSYHKCMTYLLLNLQQLSTCGIYAWACECMFMSFKQDYA